VLRLPMPMARMKPRTGTRKSVIPKNTSIGSFWHIDVKVTVYSIPDVFHA
jgi:hypothetical protein